jgi:hypothetical protein
MLFFSGLKEAFCRAVALYGSLPTRTERTAQLKLYEQLTLPSWFHIQTQWESFKPTAFGWTAPRAPKGGHVRKGDSFEKGFTLDQFFCPLKTSALGKSSALYGGRRSTPNGYWDWDRGTGGAEPAARRESNRAA